MEKERFLEIIFFVYAFFAVIFGIILIFFGEWFITASQWGSDPSMLGILGSAFVASGFASIIAWKRVDWEKVQIVVEMQMAWLTIAIVITIIFYFIPTYNVPLIAWAFVVIFIAFDFGFIYIYYMFRKD